MQELKNIDIFLQTRKPDDLDMIAQVRQLLGDSGLLPQVVQFFDTSKFIIDGINRPPEAQRFLLNKFWNLQLLLVNENTIEERFCLIPNGEYCDWLRLFKDKILPCCIAHRLPRSLDSI